MLKVTINAEGKSESDIEFAIEEALRHIKLGNRSGFDRNDSGSFDFQTEGEEEPFEEEEN